MKRFVGLLLTLAGGPVLIWGAASVLAGSPDTRLAITDEYSVTALTGGLVGAATFTLGLIGMRD